MTDTYTTLAQGVRDYFMEEYAKETDDVEKELLLDKVVFWCMEALNIEEPELFFL